MFEHVLITETGYSNKKWTMLASVATQTALVGATILIPLITTETIRSGQFVTHLFSPAAPVPPPALGSPNATGLTARTAARPFDPYHLTSPTTAPDHPIVLMDMGEAFATTPPGSEYGVPGGDARGRQGGPPGAPPITGDIALLPPPPPNPVAQPVKAPPPPTPSAPVRIGGDVQAAKLIRQPIPIYPPLARQARISGTVRLEGIISKEGTIVQLRVISGHPLLSPAALDAVRQWVYRPTLLNGVPMEVIAPIDVHFTLN